MKILEVNNLKTYFYAKDAIVKAVDGVTFDLRTGRTFGLVGESGSGKTLTALSILRLITPPGKIIFGSIIFKGRDLVTENEAYLRSIRGSRIAIVFQEPSSALNPVLTIGCQMVEAVTAHQNMNQKKSEELALSYLEKVHIKNPVKVFHDYPHQLSGGTKQRVMIATALLNSPELLILDEPTTALDVTIQAQILDLLDEVIEKEKTSILFISHDFGVISRMCDDVAVMNKGRIVEMGSKEQVLNSPRDRYTVSLLESVKALS